MKHVIISISRQYGSGGRIVAQKLAEALGVPCYDKGLIENVAKETGLTEDYIKQTENRPTGSFLFDLCSGYGFNYGIPQAMPLPDRVFVEQCKVIKKAAQDGPCVIVGRCADHVLDDRADCLRVFVSAPLDERVKRAQETYGDEADNMENFVVKRDKSRASYYNHFVGKKWGERSNYDLCVDTRIGIDAAVEVIRAAAEALDSKNN